MSGRQRWITCRTCGRKIATVNLRLRREGPGLAYMGDRQPEFTFVSGAFEDAMKPGTPEAAMPDGTKVLVCPRGHRATFVHYTK